MSEALGLVIFVVVFIVVPWGLILGLRLAGRRRGYDNLYAPPLDAPPADRPLRCRLNLFHRCADCGKTRDIPMVAPPP
jgi:hypothetical protein